MQVLATLAVADCATLQPLSRSIFSSKDPRSDVSSKRVEEDGSMSLATSYLPRTGQQPFVAPIGRQSSSILSTGSQTTLKQAGTPVSSEHVAVWAPFGIFASTSVMASSRHANTSANYGGLFFTSAAALTQSGTSGSQKKLKPNQVHFYHNHDGTIHPNVLEVEISDNAPVETGALSTVSPIRGVFCYYDYLFVVTRTQVCVYAIKLPPPLAKALRHGLDHASVASVKPQPPLLRVHGVFALPKHLEGTDASNGALPMSGAAAGLRQEGSKKGGALVARLSAGAAQQVAMSRARTQESIGSNDYFFNVLLTVVSSSASGKSSQISAVLAVVNDTNVRVKSEVRDCDIVFSEENKNCFAPLLSGVQKNPVPPPFAAVEAVDWFSKRLVLRCLNTGSAAMMGFASLFNAGRSSVAETSGALRTLDSVDCVVFSTVGVMWSVKAVHDAGDDDENNNTIALRVKDHVHNKETVTPLSAGSEAYFGSAALSTAVTSSSLLSCGLAAFFPSESADASSNALETGSCALYVGSDAGSKWSRPLERRTCVTVADDHLFILIGSKVYSRYIAASLMELKQLDASHRLAAKTPAALDDGGNNKAEKPSSNATAATESNQGDGTVESGTLHDWLLNRTQPTDLKEGGAKKAASEGNTAALLQQIFPKSVTSTSSDMKRTEVAITSVECDEPASKLQECIELRSKLLAGSGSAKGAKKKGNEDVLPILRDGNLLAKATLVLKGGETRAYTAHLVLIPLLREFPTSQAAVLRYLLHAGSLDPRTLLLILLSAAAASPLPDGAASPFFLAASTVAARKAEIKAAQWSSALRASESLFGLSRGLKESCVCALVPLCRAINAGLASGALGAVDLLSGVLDAVVSYLYGSGAREPLGGMQLDEVETEVVATVQRLAGYAQWGLTTAACTSGALSAYIGPASTATKEASIRKPEAKAIATSRSAEIRKETLVLAPVNSASAHHRKQ